MAVTDKESFVRGAAILAFAGVLGRVIGAVGRIPLTRLVGAEGMGLYQMAYSVFGIALVISVFGIPIAMSKLVAEEVAKGCPVRARRIFKIGLFATILNSSVFSCLLFLSAEFLGIRILGNPGAIYPIKAIAPAVFFVSLAGAFRGYSQGLHKMTPTAVSQLMEQTVRVFTMLALSQLFLPWGVEFAATGATFGAVTGSVAGLIALLVFFKSGKEGIRGGPHVRNGPAGVPAGSGVEDGRLRIAGRIFKYAAPVALGTLVMPLMEVVNATIVPGRLYAAGFSVRRATELYGELSGMAMTLVTLPIIGTAAIATSVTPAISASLALKNKCRVASGTREALRLSILLGLPSAVGLFVLARQISEVLFSRPTAGIPLAFLVLGLPFMCLYNTTSGVLHGLGRPFTPTKGLLLGMAISILATFSLTSIPSIGIRGAALGTAMGFTAAALFNLVATSRLVPMDLSLMGLLFRPMLAVSLMGIAAKGSYHFLFASTGNNTIGTFGGIVVAAFVYTAILLITGELKSTDIVTIPLIGRRLSLLLDLFLR